MPTLEDTIEFQASTLNDLLEADANAVALPSVSEGKYRSWAYLSTAAAGLLAILLVVALVTDSGSKSDGGGQAGVDKSAYPGMPRKVLKVTGVGTDIALNSAVDVFKGATLVIADAKVTKIDRPDVGIPTVELAMTRDQYAKAGEAFPGSTKADIAIHDPSATTTPTSAPAATPDTTPTTAPATPPPSG